jgi:hypothetical protein
MQRLYTRHGYVYYPNHISTDTQHQFISVKNNKTKVQYTKPHLTAIWYDELGGAVKARLFAKTLWLSVRKIISSGLKRHLT